MGHVVQPLGHEEKKTTRDVVRHQNGFPNWDTDGDAVKFSQTNALLTLS
jgi:hypothetical protein